MAMFSFNSPRDGRFATFEFMALNGHLIFSSLLKAYLFSYSKYGSIASTSKATTNGTPMVITVMWGPVKCKF